MCSHIGSFMRRTKMSNLFSLQNLYVYWNWRRRLFSWRQQIYHFNFVSSISKVPFSLTPLPPKKGGHLQHDQEQILLFTNKGINTKHNMTVIVWIFIYEQG